MGIVQRDSFRITLVSYAGAALGYLNKVFLFTNFLQTEQVGLANLLVTISVVYAQFAALGTRNIITRFFPFFNDPKKHHHGFLFGMMALAFAGFVLTSLAFVIFRQPFVLLYQDSSPLLVDYAIYLLPLGLAGVYYSLFEAYLRSLFNNVVPSLAHEIILRLMVTLAISLYALGVISFPAFVALYVAANCLPAVVVIIYTASRKWLLARPAYTPLLKRLARIMVVYGLYSLLNNLGGFLLISIDALMVAALIDLSATGIYTTMIYLTSVVLIPYRAMVKVSGPLVATFWKNRDMKSMQAIYSKATAGNMVVGATLFLLIWVNLDAIFHFMPQQYGAGRTVFLLIGVGKLFEMSSGLTSIIMLTSKKYRYDMMFMLGMLVFAVLGNIIFIPRWGIEGAAFASLLTLVCFNAMRILFLKYHFKIQPFKARQLWVPLILAGIMLLGGVAPMLHNVFLDVFVRSSVAALLFLVPLKLLNISPEMNAWAKNMLKNGLQFFSKKTKH